MNGSGVPTMFQIWLSMADPQSWEFHCFFFGWKRPEKFPVFCSQKKSTCSVLPHKFDCKFLSGDALIRLDLTCWPFGSLNIRPLQKFGPIHSLAIHFGSHRETNVTPITRKIRQNVELKQLQNSVKIQRNVLNE